MNKPLKCALFAFSFIILAAAIAPAHVARASSGASLSGYAWSDHVGWISFSGTAVDGSPYGVSMNTTTPTNAPLSGYAWSDHIGWISFNAADVTGCPVMPANSTCTPTVNMSTGAVTGWARVLSLSSSTGGWLELSGTNHVSPLFPPTATYDPSSQTYDNGVTYDPTTGGFFGNAWGNDIGWLPWNVGSAPTGTSTATSTPGVTTCTSSSGTCPTGPTGSAPSVTLTTSSSTVSSGSTVTLTWLVRGNPTSCTTAGGNYWPNPWTSGNSGGSVTSPAVVNTGTIFEFQCSNSAGSDAASVTINTTNNSAPASEVSMWLDNNSGNPLAVPPVPAQTTVHIHPTGTAVLNWSTTAFYNQYPLSDNPLCSGNVNSGQSVSSWTSGSSSLANGQQAPDRSSNAITLSDLVLGTYSLNLTCKATILVSGIPTHVASSSNPVTITVTNSTIHEQ